MRWRIFLVIQLAAVIKSIKNTVITVARCPLAKAIMIASKKVLDALKVLMQGIAIQIKNNGRDLASRATVQP